jgi:hypothetical protein
MGTGIMKNARQIISRSKRRGPLSLPTCGIGLILLMLASPFALAGKPVCPGDDRCKDSTQYEFKFIFEGTDPIFFENNNGVPWTVTAPAKDLGAIVAGQVPIYEDRIASIGDYYQPCNELFPPECAARFELQDLETDKITFAATGEGSNDPGSVGLFFSFHWSDDQNQYEYVAKPQGVANLLVHPWDPTDITFCVPMEFERTWILQVDPNIKKRQKQCPESQYFAVCEADDAEWQWPFENQFRAIIWRDDHPVYALYKDVDPLTPPCSF